MSSMVEDSFGSFSAEASVGKHKYVVKHSARDSDYSSSMGTAEDRHQVRCWEGLPVAAPTQGGCAGAHRGSCARQAETRTGERARSLRAVSKQASSGGAVFLSMFRHPAQ